MKRDRCICRLNNIIKGDTTIGVYTDRHIHRCGHRSTKKLGNGVVYTRPGPNTREGGSVVNPFLGIGAIMRSQRSVRAGQRSRLCLPRNSHFLSPRKQNSRTRGSFLAQSSNSGWRVGWWWTQKYRGGSLLCAQSVEAICQQHARAQTHIPPLPASSSLARLLRNHRSRPPIRANPDD